LKRRDKHWLYDAAAAWRTRSMTTGTSGGRQTREYNGPLALRVIFFTVLIDLIGSGS